MARSREAAPRQFAALVLVLALAGCEEGTTTDPTNVGPESVSVTAESTDVEIASQVQLAATVSPPSAPQTVAWSSSDQDLATVTSTGLVTPLLQGTVTITATSTVDGTVFGSIELTATCPTPRPVTENPVDGTEWENWVPDPECYDYVAQADISMSANTLEIQPGTVVAFEDDRRMRIRGNSTLLAEGTEELPIVLTGITKERDGWEGIELESTGPNHVLAWVTIEFASGEVPPTGPNPAALKIGNDVAVRLENSTIRESAGYGLRLGDAADFSGEGGNTYTANALGPAYTFASEVEHILRGASATSGNDLPDVVVSPNTIDTDTEWPFGSFRIEDPSGQNFNVLAALTLGPGVRLAFEGEGEELRILQGGSLSAVGTAVDPVLFTGTEESPGHWAGVRFLGSDSPDNRLEHVIVEYAGGLDPDPNRANLMVEFDGGVGSRLEVVRSMFRHGERYGVYLELDTNIAEFSGNTLTQNASGPLSIDAPLVRNIAEDNQLTGNLVDEITVHAGTSRPIAEATTFLDFGLPYYIKRANSAQWAITAGLTISPGVVMRMDPDMFLDVFAGGSLSAVGTASDEIVLEKHGADPWAGIRFFDASGDFDYLSITDAGAAANEAILTLETVDVDNPPGSTVSLTPNVTLSGGMFTIWFGLGDTFTTGCIGNVRIPPGDSAGDHCLPG